MVASYVYFGGEKRVRLGPRIDFLMDIFFPEMAPLGHPRTL